MNSSGWTASILLHGERPVMSLRTVKFDISNILHKRGAESRVEAVKLAVEQKLV